MIIIIFTSNFRLIFVNEGIPGLFKGLGPNLMGVFPSRAIYFWAYSTSKKNINASLPKANRDTPFVHVTSAAMAGKFCELMQQKCWNFFFLQGGRG